MKLSKQDLLNLLDDVMVAYNQIFDKQEEKRYIIGKLTINNDEMNKITKDFSNCMGKLKKAIDIALSEQQKQHEAKIKEIRKWVNKLLKEMYHPEIKDILKEFDKEFRRD